MGVPQKGWNIWVMWSENSVQTEESENWDILSDEWWVMKIEWWKLSDEKVLTKQGLNHFRQYLSLWPFLIEIGPHGSAKKKKCCLLRLGMAQRAQRGAWSSADSWQQRFFLIPFIAWIFVIIYFLLKMSLAHEVRP